MTIPVLRSLRLALRPFTLADASTVQSLAGTPSVTRTTLAIPYPYPDGAAERWIGSHEEHFEQSASVDFAIERSSDGLLIGTIGLRIEKPHQRAELGYWIGEQFWGQGYATEAARTVVEYGFERLDLQRIYAYHFTINPASGRVLEKIGMKREGLRRRHTLKDGEFLDSVAYGLLRSEHQVPLRGGA